jgi:large subunit ribosomal protein L24
MEKIRKGDQVVVIAGRDKGKKGEVIQVSKKGAMVKGISLVKKSVKKDPKKHPAGGYIEIDAPVNSSNLMLFCPKCNKPVRTGIVVDKNGKKTRACKKCQNIFE